MPAAWIERLADAFWDSAGGAPPLPRDLAAIISRTSDVCLVPLCEPSLSTAKTWLDRRGIALPLDADDRPVKGLVVAFRGRGVIFLDEALQADERRVILAHEFAHFLAEYLRPRLRVLRRLGPQVLPILDGDRALQATEEWAAMLAGVSLGVHAHFLAREFDARDDGLPPAERIANELALELLAPVRMVTAEMTRSPTREIIESELVGKYGLPPTWASGYARTIASTFARRRTFTGRLGL